MNLRKQIVLSSLIVTCVSQVGLAQSNMAAYVANSGSCTSQGAWTQKAIENSQSIFATAQAFADDPNCKGLADAIAGSANLTSQADSRGSYQAESILGELSALRTVLRNHTSAAGAINQVLAQSTLENITQGNGQKSEAVRVLQSRWKNVSERGLNVANNLFSTLPQYTKCLQNRPDLAATFFMSGVQLASAFASGGQGISPKVGETISNFLNFIQDIRFAAIQKKLNQQKIWTELSCLIESTQANYCAVADGFELIKNQQAIFQVNPTNTPLEGYFLMVREIPLISDWIQKIQLGIEPRLETDAAFKKTTWDSVVKLFNDVNDLPAIYYENYNTVYKNLDSQEKKQNNVRALIFKLTDTMSSAVRGTNFFTQSVNAELMPFFLLGRNAIPAEVLATGGNVIPVERYILNLELTPELKNPDEAMEKILVRMREISDRAMITGAEYFRTRMSVDQVNLVDESITGTALNARAGLSNVRNYLSRLYTNLQNKPESAVILPSILDTVGRIDRVLKWFSLLDAEAKRLNMAVNSLKRGYSLPDLSSYNGEGRNRMTGRFEAIISAVYLEFNILLQRDSFFTTRISTYVRHDYNNRLKGQDFTPYTQQLLLTSGNGILDRLKEYQQFNLAESVQDLSSAKEISNQNLDQLESLSIPLIEDYLLHLNRRAGRNFARTNDPLGSLVPIVGNRTVFFAAKQETHDEATNLLAKVCIQTLGFKAYNRFSKLCGGVTLKPLVNPGPSLNTLPVTVSYDRYYQDRVNKDNFVNRITNSALMPTSSRYSQVCLLRDYFRNNYVAWLTQNFGGR